MRLDIDEITIEFGENKVSSKPEMQFVLFQRSVLPVSYIQRYSRDLEIPSSPL